MKLIDMLDFIGNAETPLSLSLIVLVGGILGDVLHIVLVRCRFRS